MNLHLTHFLHCLKRLNDGRFILLNRHYKPLGIQTSEWVDYETDPSAVAINLTPTTARKLSWEGKGDIDAIFLYNDGCIPIDSDAHMAAYCKRLAVLMKVKVKRP